MQKQAQGKIDLDEIIPVTENGDTMSVGEFIGQFNEHVMMDIAYVPDQTGRKHGYLLMIDDGTDWTVAKHIGVGEKSVRHMQTGLSLY